MHRRCGRQRKRRACSTASLFEGSVVNAARGWHVDVEGIGDEEKPNYIEQEHVTGCP